MLGARAAAFAAVVPFGAAAALRILGAVARSIAVEAVCFAGSAAAARDWTWQPAPGAA